ncbi:hypothetical protein PIB30_010074 [Stylosanthes scabra]|uniref:Uncharacterized protein n=1 Tax=Stylosanthes scabra TaxID=79078 RepID=A0ABU6X3S5_9FABA|nr:hypothetical protein [Stylosanthes scabra]
MPDPSAGHELMRRIYTRARQIRIPFDRIGSNTVTKCASSTIAIKGVNHVAQGIINIIDVNPTCHNEEHRHDRIRGGLPPRLLGILTISGERPLHGYCHRPCPGTDPSMATRRLDHI